MVEIVCKVCAHKKDKHSNLFCETCLRMSYFGEYNNAAKQFRFRHIYVPDNLKYIEDIAQEKGLV